MFLSIFEVPNITTLKLNKICPCIMCAVSETTANTVVSIRNTKIQGFFIFLILRQL